jgi:hypothetical protein
MFGSSIHPHERRLARRRDHQRPLLSVPEGVSRGDAQYGAYGARNREVATRTLAQHRSAAPRFSCGCDACRRRRARRSVCFPEERAHSPSGDCIERMKRPPTFPPDRIPAVRVMRLFCAKWARSGNAHVERFIQTVQIECLDRFIVMGTSHLDHLVREFMEHYNRERPHSAIGFRTPVGRSPPAADRGPVRC